MDLIRQRKSLNSKEATTLFGINRAKYHIVYIELIGTSTYS